jgi:hypothetical protein
LYRLDNPLIPLGHTLSFAKGQPWGNWLRTGWSAPESWGVWSDGEQATIAIDPVQLPTHAENLVFHIDALVYVKPNHPRERVEVSLDGKPVASYEVTYPATKLSMTLPIASSSWVDTRKLVIRFRLPDAASPQSIGAGGDTRVLALGLVGLTLTEGDPSPPTATKNP